MSHPYVGRICPCCGRPLQKQDTVAVCDTCGTPQHLSCWQWKQSCSTPGCPGSIREVLSPGEPIQVGRTAEETPEKEPLRTEQPRKSPGKKKKRTGLAVSLCTGLILVLAAAALSAIFFFIPLSRYRDGEKELQNGNYDRAYEIFIGLDSFRDSYERSQEALYEKACALLDGKEYDAALRQFRDLKKYRDSMDMVSEVRYRQAGDALERGDCETAFSVYEDLGDYKDSRYQLDGVRYRQAEEALGNGDWETAISLFEALRNYRASNSLLLDAMSGYVESHLNNRDPKTCEYLDILAENAYEDAEDIRRALYDWEVRVFYVEDETRFGMYDELPLGTPFRIQYFIEGGRPGETINLSEEITAPDGSVCRNNNLWLDVSDGDILYSDWSSAEYAASPDAVPGCLVIKLYMNNQSYPLCREVLYLTD